MTDGNDICGCVMGRTDFLDRPDFFGEVILACVVLSIKENQVYANPCLYMALVVPDIILSVSHCCMHVPKGSWLMVPPILEAIMSLQYQLLPKAIVTHPA